MTVRYCETSVVGILFQFHGSIWIEVLPYCIVNCILSYVVIYLKQYHHVYISSFNVAGHGLLGLLVSFLVLNKLYLALERYNTIRSYVGSTYVSLREVQQLALLFSTNSYNKHQQAHQQEQEQQNNNNFIFIQSQPQPQPQSQQPLQEQQPSVNNHNTITNPQHHHHHDVHITTIDDHDDHHDENQFRILLQQYHHVLYNRILHLMDCTKHVLQKDVVAYYLARNEYENELFPKTSTSSLFNWNHNKNQRRNIHDTKIKDEINQIDPLYHVQRIRLHLYSSYLCCYSYPPQSNQKQQPQISTAVVDNHDMENDNKNNSSRMIHHYYQHYELLERTKLMDQMMIYCTTYRELLRLKSTPLPFPMIQMGRTFLFLWIYMMPLALVGTSGIIMKDDDNNTTISSWIGVLLFIFFITYGYVGLELVSMQLLNPYGSTSKNNSNNNNHVNHINIDGIHEATRLALERDLQYHISFTDSNDNNHPLYDSSDSSGHNHSNDPSYNKEDCFMINDPSDYQEQSSTSTTNKNKMMYPTRWYKRIYQQQRQSSMSIMNHSNKNSKMTDDNNTIVNHHYYHEFNNTSQTNNNVHDTSHSSIFA